MTRACTEAARIVENRASAIMSSHFLGSPRPETGNTHHLLPHDGSRHVREWTEGSNDQVRIGIKTRQARAAGLSRSQHHREKPART